MAGCQNHQIEKLSCGINVKREIFERRKTAFHFQHRRRKKSLNFIRTFCHCGSNNATTISGIIREEVPLLDEMDDKRGTEKKDLSRRDLLKLWKQEKSNENKQARKASSSNGRRSNKLHNKAPSTSTHERAASGAAKAVPSYMRLTTAAQMKLQQPGANKKLSMSVKRIKHSTKTSSTKLSSMEKNKTGESTNKPHIATKKTVTKTGSFAPENFQFNFKSKLQGTPCSLPSIAEDGSPVGHSRLARPPLTPAGDMIHQTNNDLLLTELRAATSPEEKLEVLAKSPGISLIRRKRPRPSSPVYFDADSCVDGKCESNSENAGSVTSITKPTIIERPAITAESTTPRNTIAESATVKLAPIPAKDVKYFKDLVDTNTHTLEGLATQWDQINAELTAMNDDVAGDVRTTVCQARLLIAERFSQFSGLIKQCEDNSGEKKVLCEDLEGFWDMIYYQVEDIINKFRDLAVRKDRNWLQDAVEISKPIKKKPIKRKAVIKSKGPSKFAQFRAAMQHKTCKDIHDVDVKVKEMTMDNTAQAGIGDPEIKKLEKRHSSGRAITIQNADNDQGQISTPGQRRYSFRRSTILSSARKSATKSCVSVQHMISPHTQMDATSTPQIKTKKRASKAKVNFQMPSPALSPDVCSSFLSDSQLPAKRARRDTPYKRATPCKDKENITASPALSSFVSKSQKRERISLHNSCNELMDCSNVSLRNSSRPLKSCSPTPTMVNAMLSASKSGKSRSSRRSPPIAEPVHEECLNGSLSDYLPVLPSIDSSKKPDSLHKSLLKRSLKQSHQNLLTSESQFAVEKLSLSDDEEDLIVFSPMNLSRSQSIKTPRRSVRLVKKTTPILK